MEENIQIEQDKTCNLSWTVLEYYCAIIPRLFLAIRYLVGHQDIPQDD